MQEDIEEAKTKARRLREFLASRGLVLGQGEALDALSAIEGLSGWNVHSAALARKTGEGALFCPHCGHRGKVRDIGFAKLQQGPWLIDNYMFEGDGTQYVCLVCNGQFVDWNAGSLFRNRDHLVAIVAELEEGGWSLEAYEAIDVARALNVDEWESLQRELKHVSGETLLQHLEWLVPSCESALDIDGATREEVLRQFSARRESPVLAIVEY